MTKNLTKIPWEPEVLLRQSFLLCRRRPEYRNRRDRERRVHVRGQKKNSLAPTAGRGFLAASFIRNTRRVWYERDASARKASGAQGRAGKCPCFNANPMVWNSIASMTHESKRGSFKKKIPGGISEFF